VGRLARTGGIAGITGLAALAAWEATVLARAVRVGDPGGRADHAGTVGSGLGEPLRLVLLGDSAVDGYGLPAEQALPRQLAVRIAIATGRRVAVRSIAVSGATSRDVASFQVPLLRAAGQVDAVVVGVGVNDALRRVRAPEVEDATRATVEGVRGVVPDATFVYVPCHDLTEAPGFGPVLGRVVGLRCRTVARRQHRVLEDLHVEVAETDRRGTPEMFGPDGLHPGAAGVEVIASLIAGRLVRPAVGADV
jgi:lysophospholipase L1-like esterase